MRWVPKSYERKLRRERQREWHRWWAWRPVVIPEHKCDSVVVPKMRVWREYVDRRGSLFWYLSEDPQRVMEARAVGRSIHDETVGVHGSIWWEYRTTDNQEPIAKDELLLGK